MERELKPTLDREMVTSIEDSWTDVKSLRLTGGVEGNKVNAYAVDADGLADLQGRGAPRQEHNTLTGLTLFRCNAPGRDGLQNGGCEGLPALLRVRMCFVGSNSQASIQPQHALFSDFGEIAGGRSVSHLAKVKTRIRPMVWCSKTWYIRRDLLINIPQRRGRFRGREDGKRQASRAISAAGPGVGHGVTHRELVPRHDKDPWSGNASTSVTRAPNDVGQHT